MKTKAQITSRGETRSIFIRLSFAAYEKVKPSDVNPGGKKYRRIEYYTGLTVKPKDWDTSRGKTKNNSFINRQIIDGCIRIEKIFHENTYNTESSFEVIKEAVKTDQELINIFGKNIQVSNISEAEKAFTFIDSFIERSNVSDGTKKDYLNSLMHLKNFDVYRGKDFNWKDIDHIYYLELVGYLKNQTLKPSTIDKIIKNLKVFLQTADLSKELEVNQDFKKVISGKSLFAKVNKEETEHVYLDEKEIDKISNAFIDNERLSEIRDLFIIGCWTGLRISDLSRLERSNIKDGLISITTKKTQQNIVIPITTELQKVLDKHPESWPSIPSDAHFNREIKKVCEIAKIDTMVKAEIKINGRAVITDVPKHEQITSHTARRSFATNLYRRGIPSSQLMMLTGHRTEEAFLKYIKVTREDNARDVAERLNIIV